MNILFITYENHNDIKAWSGMMYTVATYLNKENHIEYFDNIGLSFFSKIVIAMQILLDKIFGKKTKYLRLKSVMKDISRKIQKRVDCNDFDIIFTMRPHLLSYVNTNKPIVIFADCNFQSMIGYYDSFSNLRSGHINICNAQEKIIFEKCALGLFTSPWALETSAQNYSINKEKFKCVNIGSNMLINHSIEDINKFIHLRKKAVVKRILFVGVDWIRKGGEIAVHTVFLLNKQGYKCKLIIIGCTPVIEKEFLPYVEIIGRIDKSTKEGLLRLDEEYKNAYCFLFPTKKECAAVSLAEASAYGLYSFTTNTGGTNGVVFDNINGCRLPVDSDPKVYAKMISELLEDEKMYEKKSLQARRTFECDLNWDTICHKINKYIHNLIN